MDDYQLRMTFFTLELVISRNCAMIFHFHFFSGLLITRPKSVVVDLFNTSRIMLSCLCRFSKGSSSLTKYVNDLICCNSSRQAATFVRLGYLFVGIWENSEFPYHTILLIIFVSISIWRVDFLVFCCYTGIFHFIIGDTDNLIICI